MNKKWIICIIVIVTASCGAQKAQLTALQNRIDSMEADSVWYEKRIRALDDEKNYLAQKCATIEQAYTNRLLEKEDSLSHKEQLLRERELNLADMKARKEQEKEAFSKLSQSVFAHFSTLNESISTRTNCSQIIVEISDKLLFQPNSFKANEKQEQILNKVAEALRKNDDLQLLVIAHTDSINHTKEKVEDLWALGALKANVLVRTLIKEQKINEQKVSAVSKGAGISTDKQNQSLGKNRVAFVFYSTFLPCVHVE